MSKWMMLQAFYCIVGICFFVKDLFEKVPLGNGMVRAFIWPYAQWPFIHRQGLELIEPILKMIQ